MKAIIFDLLDINFRFKCPRYLKTEYQNFLQLSDGNYIGMFRMVMNCRDLYTNIFTSPATIGKCGLDSLSKQIKPSYSTGIFWPNPAIYKTFMDFLEIPGTDKQYIGMFEILINNRELEVYTR